MVRYTIALMLIGLCPPAALAAQDAENPNRFIPATISQEAQDFIRNAPPIPPAPETLEEWEARQAETEEKERPRSKKAVEALAEKPEIRKMAGVNVHVITPKRFNPHSKDKALIHIHGGGFCTYSSESSYFVCATLADRTGLKVYCIDYRLAPQNPFPAGLNDCVSAYREIIKEVAPNKVGAFGISAGGTLILAMTLKARDEGLPMPAALAAITPLERHDGCGRFPWYDRRP